MNKKGIFACISTICAIALFAVILIVPPSRQVFKSLSANHAFIMGFFKFGILATAGELIAIRISTNKWNTPPRLALRAFIWGIIGIAITFMMKIYSGGVAAITQSGVLYGKDVAILKAFYTSAIMNLTFGPVFMAFHKCTDMWISLTAQNKPRKINDILSAIDWKQFVNFTLFKTIPIFWIPAHTITFMLPPEYQVVMAAALSIALGIFLSLKNKSGK